MLWLWLRLAVAGVLLPQPLVRAALLLDLWPRAAATYYDPPFQPERQPAQVLQTTGSSQLKHATAKRALIKHTRADSVATVVRRTRWRLLPQHNGIKLK